MNTLYLFNYLDRAILSYYIPVSVHKHTCKFKYPPFLKGGFFIDRQLSYVANYSMTQTLYMHIISFP